MGAPAQESRPRGRATKQKRAVGALLEGTDEFTSAQDLHARLKARGDQIGLATVYAQLRQLADAGDIDSVRSESGETLYRRCVTPAHHHHLVCRRCGATVEVDAPELESLARRLGQQQGYTDVEHVMEISGLCAQCRTHGGR
ncbi:MAG: Fur family transcriptional regulator [Acidimicrobiales bacterium]